MMIFGRKMAKDLLYHVPPSGIAKAAVFDARMVEAWRAYGAPKANSLYLSFSEDADSRTSSWALSSSPEVDEVVDRCRRLEKMFDTSMSLRRVSPICSEV